MANSRSHLEILLNTPEISLVLDNLNAHRTAPLYEAFPAPEARRIARRLVLHHTPRRGRRLNMMEMEFRVLAWVCLRGHEPDEESMGKAVTGDLSECNAKVATITWRFTAMDALRKIHCFYQCHS